MLISAVGILSCITGSRPAHAPAHLLLLPLKLLANTVLTSRTAPACSQSPGEMWSQLLDVPGLSNLRFEDFEGGAAAGIAGGWRGLAGGGESAAGGNGKRNCR